MRIRLKLYATLGKYLPPEAVANAVEIEADEDASPNAILDRFGVPREAAHLVLINGVFVPRSERDGAGLADGDTLAIWPPVAGG